MGIFAELIAAHSQRIVERDGIEGFDQWWALLGALVWTTMHGSKKTRSRSTLPPIEPPY